jgi:hypothetical protein
MEELHDAGAASRWTSRRLRFWWELDLTFYVLKMLSWAPKRLLGARREDATVGARYEPLDQY